MPSTDPEALAARYLTEVRAIEDDTLRFATTLGYAADLDRLTLLPATHEKIPHTASLRRRLAVAGDLLEQAGAGLFRVHLTRPLPKNTATMLLFAIHSVQEILREAHRAACTGVEREALGQLGVAATTMRQITQDVNRSPLLAGHRAAVNAAKPS
ncbi:hypothetical protein ABT263_29395 [Kitasatospora sp. NPDC001603]|uniref:hypothetical protein n=1 Tax=Kitasatospora sp. NPDC001603 TaxID=3154388 RepID=UPI0033213A00